MTVRSMAPWSVLFRTVYTGDVVTLPSTAESVGNGGVGTRVQTRTVVAALDGHAHEDAVDDAVAGGVVGFGVVPVSHAAHSRVATERSLT